MAPIGTGQILGHLISSLHGFRKKISDINQRYAIPKIRMSKWVRLTLFVLRLYLIFLVLLLGYKFWTLVR
jgi:hypothetical protein